MKKTLITLITLMALGGVAVAADSLSPIWTQESITLQNDNVYDLSSLNLNTTTGYTLMMNITLGAAPANGPLCFITNSAIDTSSTTAVNAYAMSTGSVGFSNQQDGMITFSTSGSQGGTYTSGEDKSSAISFIKNDNSGAYSTTLFLTSQNGTATLYELTETGTVVFTHSRGSMGTGNLAQLIVGDWWAGTNGTQTQQTGTMNASIYSGVLTVSQMNSLIPEPTTATLSLLALAGLAVRRRRK